MTHLQPNLHPTVTFDMAVYDKTYSLLDIQLVVEEAYQIDPQLCAQLVLLHMPSRDAMAWAKMTDQRVMKAFLKVLDEHAPVLWLNAVAGVYRSQQTYNGLVM